MTFRYGQRTLVESYDDVDRSCEGIVKNINKVPWKYGIYSRQSWSNWLHKMAPYAGRMKPAIAHWLIIFPAKEDDLILDP